MGSMVEGANLLPDNLIKIVVNMPGIECINNPDWGYFRKRPITVGVINFFLFMSPILGIPLIFTYTPYSGTDNFYYYYLLVCK